MLQTIRALVLIISFIIYPLQADVNIYERTDQNVDVLNGTKVQDMPYGYFVPSFGKTTMKVLEDSNLSSYENKKILVGYGSYDINDENCRYLDMPSGGFDLIFEKMFVTSKQTFAISRSKMSHQQCLDRVRQFNGYIFTPNSSTQSVQMHNTFERVDYWLGYSRPSCTEEYTNDEGYNQSYTHYLSEAELCEDPFYYSSKIEDSLFWKRSEATEEHYCPIMIDSPDYTRPIKTCLPWWRVERKWQLDDTDGIFEYNGRKFDFRYMQYLIDYPKEQTICTKINTDILLNGIFPSSFNGVNLACTTAENIFEKEYDKEFIATCNTSTNNTVYQHYNASYNCKLLSGNSYTCTQQPKKYEKTCLSYYSLTASPVCMNNIYDEVCKINECEGYIKDNCVKTDTLVPFKDYDVKYILEEGVETRVKDKVDKEIHVYDCPEPSTSIKNCLERQQVKVFPAHCPGSMCDDLSICLQGDMSAEECMAQYPCEKNYGSVDNIIRDQNGIAIALRGTCSDGSIVDAPVEVKSRTKKQCLEYNKIFTVDTREVKCVSEASKVDKVVTASITEDDVYMDDNRCVRTNNLAEARPSVDTVFSYDINGYFKTLIQKAEFTNEYVPFETDSSSVYMVLNSKQVLKPFGDIKAAEISSDTTLQSFCNENLPSTNLSKRGYLLADTYSGSQTTIKGFLRTVNTENIDKCPTGYSLRNNRCEMDVPACIGTYYDINDTCTGEFYCQEPSRDKNICYDSIYHSYPIIGVSTDKSVCSNVSTSTGLLDITPKKVLYSDYDFASLGINSSVDPNSLCIVGGSAETGDMFHTIKDEGGDTVLFQTKNTYSDSVCEDIGKCLQASIVSNGTTCSVRTVETLPQEAATVDTYTPPTALELPSGTGTVASDFNGYSNIFSVQEYIEGEFGYFSNYMSYLPINNSVTIGDKEISPIIINESVLDEIDYTYNNYFVAETDKNKEPSSVDGYGRGYAMSSTLTSGYNFDYTGFDGVTTFLGENEGAAIALGLITGGITPILMLFGSNVHYGWFQSHYTLNKVQERYVPNVYGNDPRIILDGKILYDKKEFQTGVLKEGDFLRTRKSLIDAKKDKLKYRGYSPYMVTQMTNSSPETKSPSWDSIEWYKLDGRKQKSVAASGVKQVSKPVNTVYIGAVNNLSIVVPYKGEYEVVAFNEDGQVLGTQIVSEFIRNGKAASGLPAQTYAQVKFGLSPDFNIAGGLNYGLNDNACLASSSLEWGGGVSGIYYEQTAPDVTGTCQKSNDEYVLNHSATTISVRAINSTVPVFVKLIKPMPFANRIFLISLDNLENRKYSCYETLESCAPSGYTIEEGLE